MQRATTRLGMILKNQRNGMRRSRRSFMFKKRCQSDQTFGTFRDEGQRDNTLFHWHPVQRFPTISVKVLKPSQPLLTANSLLLQRQRFAIHQTISWTASSIISHRQKPWFRVDATRKNWDDRDFHLVCATEACNRESKQKVEKVEKNGCDTKQIMGVRAWKKWFDLFQYYVVGEHDCKLAPLERKNCCYHAIDLW